MVKKINVSVPDEQHEFLDEMNMSASAILQDAIEEKMEDLEWD